MLDKQLARGRFVAGEEYTIADMAIWPWYGNVVLGNVYNAAEFLDAGSYKNVLRWAQDVGNRPAVQRGRMVNRTSGPLNEQLHERHDARPSAHARRRLQPPAFSADTSQTMPACVARRGRPRPGHSAAWSHYESRG